jgi:hypothetical protein
MVQLRMGWRIDACLVRWEVVCVVIEKRRKSWVWYRYGVMVSPGVLHELT